MKRSRSPQTVLPNIGVVSRIGGNGPGSPGSCSTLDVEAWERLGLDEEYQQATRSPIKKKFSNKQMEEKMQTLPYLENIAYIQIHLSQRQAIVAENANANRQQRKKKKRKRQLVDDEDVGKSSLAAMEQIEREEREEKEHEKNNQEETLDEKLYNRYPRFCQLLCIQDAPNAKIQSLHWLLQTIEDVYDSRERAIRRLFFRDRAKAIQLGTFPKCAFDHLQQAYGLESLASQCGWDLVVTLDHILRDWSQGRMLGSYGVQIEIFSNMLREMLDQDVSFLFISMRRSIQSCLGVNLSQEKKTCTREMKGIGIEIAKQNCMLDEALLNENACMLVGERIFRDLGVPDDLLTRFQEFFSKRIVFKYDTERKKTLQWLGEDDPDIRFRPNRQRKTYPRRLTASHILNAALQCYKDIPEDIIKEIKHSDDGNRVHMLGKLKSTLEITKFKEDTQKQMEVARIELRSLQATQARLERKCNIDEAHRQQYRTELFIAKNDVWRKEQELEDLLKQVKSLSKQIEATWDSVLVLDEPDVGGKRKRESRKNAEEITITRSQPSVRMFTKWIERQFRQYTMKVKATKRLKAIGGWREQLEQRRTEAAILVQRAYRERLRLRELESEAAKESYERRKQIRAERKAKEQLRIRQEKQAEKHKARLEQKAKEKASQRDEISKRQRKIISKHREAEAERRLQRHLGDLKKRCFIKWIKACRVARHKNKVYLKKLRTLYRKWKQYVRMQKMVYRRQNESATEIQRLVRGHMGRKIANNVRMSKMDREEKVKLGVRRTLNRHAIRCLTEWHLHVEKMKRAKGFMAKNLTSLNEKMFSHWKLYTTACMDEKTRAASLIQSLYRIRQAKRELAAYRLKWFSSIKIQTCWRIYLCKTLAARAKRYKEETEAKVSTYIRRIKWRRQYDYFQAWETSVNQKKKVRSMFKYKMDDLRKRLFRRWVSWLKYWLELQLKCAVLIQNIFRRRMAQRAFRIALEKHYKAIRIQAQIRRIQAERKAETMYWNRESSTKIQRIWRGRRARKFYIQKLSKYILQNCKKENYGTVYHALEHKGIDPRSVVDTETGDTLLHRACANGAKRIVKLCLRKGLKLGVRNHKKETCLHAVATTNTPFLGKDQLADYLLSKGVRIDSRDKEGKTALMQAAVRGLTALVTCLVEFADLEIKDLEGNTALHLALLEEEYQVVRILLDAGANKYCTDNNGTHPLHDLAANGMTEMMQVLIPFLAEDEGGLDVIDKNGRTAIHYAVVEREMAAAKLLVDWGASVLTLDELGRAALWYAAKNGDLTMMNYLLENDSPVESQCKKTGRTSLHIACTLMLNNPNEAEEHFTLVKTLLTYGANVNVQDSKGDMPIHLACGQDNVRLVRVLIKYDCDVNIKNYAGLTPLGAARMHNANNVIKYILKRYLERDRETQWEMDERRKGEALTAMLGQLKFTKTQETPKALETAAVDIVEAIEKEQTEALPEFTLDEWYEVLQTRSFLEVEMGLLTNSPWQKHRIIGYQYTVERQIENEDGEMITVYDEKRADDYLSGQTYWHDPENQVFQWTTPKAMYDLPEAKDNWVQQWDEENQCVTFYNENTGRTVKTDKSGKPPPASGGKYLEKKIKKRILVGGLPTTTAGESCSECSGDDDDLATGEGVNVSDYQKYWEEENKEMRIRMQQQAAALVIQSQYRRYISAVRSWRARVMRDMAIRLQANWRAILARKEAKRRIFERAQATKIQAVWRCFSMSRWYYWELQRLEHERIVWEATCNIQRYWRGYLGRRSYRRIVAEFVDPAPKYKEDWPPLLSRDTTKHIRTFKVWEEYLFQWPDVKIYQNKVTNVCTWKKPRDMETCDQETFADIWQLLERGFTKEQEKYAIWMQNVYRGRRNRRQFLLMVKGARIMREAEDKYLEHPYRIETSASDKEGIVNLCNYVLKLHVIDHNVDKARTLYDRAVNYMVNRGPDNAFVLRSFAIFLCGTLEDDFDAIMELIYRADIADPNNKTYLLAEAGFYRQATLDQPNNAKALFNYALCLQFFGTCLSNRAEVRPDYELAEEYYLKALQVESHNKIILENFNFMLRNLKGADYDGYEAFMDRQMEMGRAAHDKVVREEEERLYSKPITVIQRLIRGFIARRAVWRLVTEEWEVCLDDDSGTNYYYSTFSGDTRWDAPFGFNLGPQAPVEIETWDNTEPVVPWEIHMDENGDTFYFNPESGQSAWELPEGYATLDTIGGDWEIAETEEGDLYYYNSSTGETTWENRVVVDTENVPVEQQVMLTVNPAIVSKEWEVLEDEEGHVFYQNLRTGLTQWELPTELLKTGAFVYGQFQGDEYWYPGRIREKNKDNTYAIDYDDGDEESNVPVLNIMLRDPIKLADRAKVNVRMESDDISLTVQLGGTIVSGNERSDGGPDFYTVLYDDGSEEVAVAAYRINLATDDQANLESWEQVISESGLCYYRNNALRIAQWDVPATCEDLFMDPVDFESLFSLMDANKDGTLERREIFEAINDYVEVKEFIEKIPALGMLKDDFFLRKTYLSLDESGKGYVTPAEFKSTCIKICRESQLERDLNIMFALLDEDGSCTLEKTELEKALFNDKLLEYIRMTPTISALLRPSVFSYLIKTVNDFIQPDDFIRHAKNVLFHANDVDLANTLYRSQTNKTYLEQFLTPQAIRKCRKAKSKTAFVKHCVTDLERTRLRGHALTLFRLIDEDSSGTVDQLELTAAVERTSIGLDGEEHQGEVALFIKAQPRLADLLDPEVSTNTFLSLSVLGKDQLTLEDFVSAVLDGA